MSVLFGTLSILARISVGAFDQRVTCDAAKASVVSIRDTFVLAFVARHNTIRIAITGFAKVKTAFDADVGRVPP